MSDTSNTDGGLGKEGTIPDSEDGIAVTLGEDSNFNPEEDEEADDELGDEAYTPS
jgi:hypothetical protein